MKSTFYYQLFKGESHSKRVHFFVNAINPDLELKEEVGGGGGGVLLFLPCWPFSLTSVISSFFTQNKGGGGAGPPAPSPRSATGY